MSKYRNVSNKKRVSLPDELEFAVLSVQRKGDTKIVSVVPGTNRDIMARITKIYKDSGITAIVKQGSKHV